ncbi:MAG: BatA domain-containing protein [Planctomycetota bacterium]
MSFLQPWMLFALPAIALPILIHLLNRRRHRPVPWGAMMFLEHAKRMSRGMARLKQILILALRTLAVAALIFAASRPLSRGWLGVAAGGPPDTILVLLDRSASMEDQDVQTGQSKRSAALTKIADLITTLGEGPRLVLIESTSNEPVEIESAKALLDLPQTGETATAADIPAMLESAEAYMSINETGRTDVWLCSDQRRSDWDPGGGRWGPLRDSFQERESVQLYLLTYPEVPPDNVAITVPRIERRQIGSNAEIVLDIHLRRNRSDRTAEFPIEIVLNGARSILPVEMTDTELILQGHTIPIDSEIEEGTGRLEIPFDANPSDNVYFIAFAPPPVRKAVVVSDDAVSARALRLAAGTSLDPAVETAATILPPDRAEEIPWDDTALILWHAPLPGGILAEQLRDFAGRGRSLVVFPPDEPSSDELFGMKWSSWRKDTSSSVKVASWRWDTDLLANSAGGRSLPVGELETYRYCAVQGPGRDLARFETGDPLLRRAADDGSVYFCATLPRSSHSSLARDGIAFYVMVQRALEDGARSLARAQQLEAARRETEGWSAVALRNEGAVPAERPLQGGVFETELELIAVNRPASEDLEETVPNEEIDGLFEGLEAVRVEAELGSTAALANEVWHVFLIAMALCLIGEAILTLPEKKKASGGTVA